MRKEWNIMGYGIMVADIERSRLKQYRKPQHKVLEKVAVGEDWVWKINDSDEI